MLENVLHFAEIEEKMSADQQSTTKASVDSKDQANQKPGFFSFENMRSLAVLIIAIFALRWSIASPYHVPTASMEPTIKVGDRLLAFKLAYNLKVPFTDFVAVEWKKPQRGDIIVFKYPKDVDTDYVKRVVGLPGDRLELVDDILQVNGKPMERIEANNDRTILEDIEDHKELKLLFKENLDRNENDILTHWVMQNIPSARRFSRSSWPPSGSPQYVVPDNMLFVMGDNRDNSTDSRIWGEVPMSYVRGKALFVIWSVFNPPESSWPQFRFNRFGKWLD